MTAPKRYEDLVRAIGAGFHPDTSGDDYVQLPEGVTPELVDELVEQAHMDTFNHGMTDPYTRALEALGATDPIDHEALD